MTDPLRRKPSQKNNILLLVLICAPMIVGCAAIYMWFIPNSDLKLPAEVIGGGYVLLTVLLGSLVGRVNYVERWRQQGGGTKQIIYALVGLLLIGFSSFMVAFRAIPAECTQLFGHPTDRAFSVTEIFRHTSQSRAICPYTITLKSLQGGPGTDFCLDEESANHLHVGEQVHLRGKETYFGFKFDSYSG